MSHEDEIFDPSEIGGKPSKEKKEPVDASELPDQVEDEDPGFDKMKPSTDEGFDRGDDPEFG